MERWVEHYPELYSHKNMASIAAFSVIQPLPIQWELDAEPAVDEQKRPLMTWHLQRIQFHHK